MSPGLYRSYRAGKIVHPAWGGADLVRRFTEAGLAADAGGIAALLRETSASRCRPPPGVHAGRDTVVRGWIEDGFESMKHLRAVPTGGGDDPRPDPEPARPVSRRITGYRSNVGDLRVMTFNVLSPENGDWARRRPVIQDGIAKWRPDLIALQEVVRGDGEDQVQRLLGEDYHVVHHSRRSANGVGAALASRWPVGTVREIDLRVTDRVDLPWSAAVVAEIDVHPPIGPLLFVHHKPAWQVGYADERERQAVTCARFVAEQLTGRSRHVVLAGDFDDTPDSASVRFWTGKQSLHGVSVAYRDAWAAVHPDDPGHTFTPVNPLERAGEMSLELGRRIDYVMVRCGIHGPTLDVVDCRPAFDEPVDGVWASDHFGVVADLSVPVKPPG